MDKKLVYIGLALFAIAILLIFAAPSIAFKFNTTTLNSTLSPSQLLAYPITLAKPSVLLIIYQASHNINFYLVNATAYGAMKGASPDTYYVATAHEGNGTYEIAHNYSSGTFPQEFANSSQGYFYKNSTILPAGVYYALFQGNARNSTSLAYQINVNSSISSNLFPIAALGLIFIVALVGAVITIGYGLVKKADAANDASSEVKIQKAYDQLEGKSAHTHKHKKKGP